MVGVVWWATLAGWWGLGLGAAAFFLYQHSIFIIRGAVMLGDTGQMFHDFLAAASRGQNATKEPRPRRRQPASTWQGIKRQHPISGSRGVRFRQQHRRFVYHTAATSMWTGDGYAVPTEFTQELIDALRSQVALLRQPTCH